MTSFVVLIFSPLTFCNYCSRSVWGVFYGTRVQQTGHTAFETLHSVWRHISQPLQSKTILICWNPIRKVGCKDRDQDGATFRISPLQVIVWSTRHFFQPCSEGAKRVEKGRRWVGVRHISPSRRRWCRAIISIKEQLPIPITRGRT